MNQKLVIKILDALGGEYSKNWTDNEKSIKLNNWNTALNDVTDEQGRAGLEKALKSPREFMPSVGQFREMCLAGTGLSLEEDAVNAWGIVERHLAIGKSPVFKDSAIAETIRNMGGWKRLAMCDYSELPFRKKDFIDSYPIYRRQKYEFNPVLPGIYGYNEEYQYIGYSGDDDLAAVRIQIEENRSKENRLLGLMKKIK